MAYNYTESPESATGNTQQAERYGDKAAVAQMIGMSRRTVDNLVAAGCPHLRISSRRLRFDMAEVRCWLHERFHTQRRAA